LLKIALQGIFLWHFHVHMYYNLNWFISSIFLLSPLVTFLWWFQQILKFCIYSCIESISTIFTFLTSFFYPPLLVCVLSLVWLVFNNISVFVLGPYSIYERKHAAFGLLNLANFT
jgi:hypothetical protein